MQKGANYRHLFGRTPGLNSHVKPCGMLEDSMYGHTFTLGLEGALISLLGTKEI